MFTVSLTRQRWKHKLVLKQRPMLLRRLVIPLVARQRRKPQQKVPVIHWGVLQLHKPMLKRRQYRVPLSRLKAICSLVQVQRQLLVSLPVLTAIFLLQMRLSLMG